MKNIFHITIAHKRRDSRIFHRIAKSISKKNYKVKLIVADGQGNEFLKNIDILDFGGNNFILKNHFSKQLRILFKLFNAKSILHFHEPILLPLAIVLKSFGNIVVFDMHENLHLQIITKNWRIPKLMKLLIAFLYRKFENILLKYIDGITVPQPVMVNMYKKYNPRIISIANFYISDKSHESDGFIQYKNFKNLIYSGTVSEERGFSNMINLIKNLPSDYILHIAGEVQEKLKNSIPKNLNKRLVFHGYLNVSDLTELYKICGIGLIMFNNIGQYYMSYSLKLFEYIYYGMFIIMPDFGEWLKFNKKYLVGINVNSKSSKECANKIKDLDLDYLKKVSIKNSVYVNRNFIWSKEVDKLINFYQDISK